MEQPGAGTGSQVTGRDLGRGVEVGRSTANARTKETALGQLAGLCFNSDTMWQQRLQGQQKTIIRLLVFSRPRLRTDWGQRTPPRHRPRGLLTCTTAHACSARREGGAAGSTTPAQTRESLAGGERTRSSCKAQRDVTALHHA